MLLIHCKDQLFNAAAHSENHIKYINTVCGQNAEFLNFKAGSTVMNVLNCGLIMKQAIS
jgi:hypothetical protein